MHLLHRQRFSAFRAAKKARKQAGSEYVRCWDVFRQRTLKHTGCGVGKEVNWCCLTASLSLQYSPFFLCLDGVRDARSAEHVATDRGAHLGDDLQAVCAQRTGERCVCVSQPTEGSEKWMFTLSHSKNTRTHQMAHLIPGSSGGGGGRGGCNTFHPSGM